MENSKNNQKNGCIKKYRYLLTIARRSGANDIIFRFNANNGASIFEIKLPRDVDGIEVEEYIRRKTKKNIKIGEYIGNEIKVKENSTARYFLFSCEMK